MYRFTQLHVLTSWGPSNLNRDELGAPKSAILGGKPRLRISSQCLKRAWRTSDLFEEALAGHIGTRTKRIGTEIVRDLEGQGVKKSLYEKIAKAIAGQFGKLKPAPKESKDKKSDAEVIDPDKLKKEYYQQFEIEQLVHISPAEQSAINSLVETCVAEEREPKKEELNLLKKEQTAVDIALFGRMLASHTNYNVNAAAQVAHAITVHAVTPDDDYFTAVDDLNDGQEDAGSSHIGENKFGAGVYYLYVCIDREQLLKNLDGDHELVGRTIAALTESIAKISPNGKQNSYASRAYASYILAEQGDQQPRALSSAFLEEVRDKNQLTGAIKRLKTTRDSFDETYTRCSAIECEMNVIEKNGTFQNILDFVKE